ncbi:hypothetical protein MOQ72_43710 [Saccharopolyspora sp. K220]|uniref:hypothetical protein n=1 Tax=Saccharopolyspora soli TaxID=2926618 RepID=UPI001F55B975|nr:hypothetical protein [Saccharopolyspora soli]MCI2424319.1 hypothetical protein [Saccharopolyspora soli]
MSRVTDYMIIAEQLLAAADQRPEERVRLASAAQIASDAARAAQHDIMQVHSGYLDQAVDLVKPCITEPLQNGVIMAARTFLSLAKTWADKHRHIPTAGFGSDA